MNQYDLIVVGSGPAGARGAIQARKLGKSARHRTGKTGRRRFRHTGTIPSKTLRETALNLTGLARARLLRPLLSVTQEISAEDLRRRLIITLNTRWRCSNTSSRETAYSTSVAGRASSADDARDLQR